jgi:hypothetical protein
MAYTQAPIGLILDDIMHRVHHSLEPLSVWCGKPVCSVRSIYHGRDVRKIHGRPSIRRKLLGFRLDRILQEILKETISDWQQLDLDHGGCSNRYIQGRQACKEKHKSLGASSSIKYIPSKNGMALPVARWENQQFLLFLDRFRMTCYEARHWISVLHSDWTR